MRTDRETLHQVSDKAQSDDEALEMEARKRRVQLTNAQRRTRLALRQFECDRHAYVEAAEPGEGR